MALPYSYKTGTASVTANSKTVTGTDTKWLAAGLQAGDVFAVQGLPVSIASVETSTSLTLDFAWPGSTATETSYEARYTPDATRVMAYARQAIDTMSEFDANLYGSLNVYASTAAGIAAVADGSQFSVVSGNDWIRYRRSGSGAVELRYDAVFQVQTFSRQTLQNLSGGTLDLTKQQNTQRPSVVIRRMSENAALWDLARQYRTTAQSIQQANHLTQPEADAGRLLLIPM